VDLIQFPKRPRAREREENNGPGNGLFLTELSLKLDGKRRLYDGDGGVVVDLDIRHRETSATYCDENFQPATARRTM